MLALGMYGTQLVLNALWSVLFFRTRRPRLAFVEIIRLWSAILATLVTFARVRTAAGALLLPYLAWSTYAAALNGAIWRLNRSKLTAERAK
jgi:benzodiazapine receptor